MRKGIQHILFIAALVSSHFAIAQQDSINKIKELDEVVVTGQFTPQPLRNSVYKVRTITAERIRMRAATDLTGVLNSELGIRFATDNLLGETDTRIMGIGGSRVKILIDGIPLVDRDATKQSLTQIDVNSIEKIEMVEGPMSVTYGTDALAGVINIITKKGIKGNNNLSVAARVQEESVGNTYSPFAEEGIHNENITVNWNNTHWKASGYVTRNNFGGYTGGLAFPAKLFKPKEQWIGGGTFGYRNNKVNTWYRLDYLNEDLFAANPMNVNNYISVQQHYITNRYTHQAQADWQLNAKLKINASASLQDYTRNTETYDKNYSTGTSTVNNPAGAGLWDVSKFQTWFFRSTAAWIISPMVSLQPGFDIKSDRTSGQRIAGIPVITDYAVFVSSEIRPNKFINIRPGVRFSKNSVYDAPPVIPSINTKFTLNKYLDLRLSYARGFRAPILRELYFDFVDANHTIKGNPNLEAEHSNSYMASLSTSVLSLGNVKLSSSFSGFYNDYSNFIDTYIYKDANNRDVFSYFNLLKYRNIGATLENTFIWQGLTATTGISYIAYYNQQLQRDPLLKGDRSTYAWAPEVNANLSYRIKPLATDIGFYYKFNGRIPTYAIDATNSSDIVVSKRDAFHWADLTASKQVCKYLSVQAGIKNLFDIKNLNSTAQVSTGAHSTGPITNYAYGRSYFVGLNFQWNQSPK